MARARILSTLVTLALGSMAEAAAAQVIRGRVVDAHERAPVAGALLIARDAAGLERATSLSDSTGAFFLALAQPGEYTLSAEQLGYATIEGEPLLLALGDVVEVEVRLAARPVQLDPIIVRQRSRFDTGSLQQFYRRMERMRSVGLGQFVTRQDIQDRNPTQVTDILQGMHGIHTIRIRGRATADAVLMRRGGAPCVPAFYIDGIRLMRTLGQPELFSVDDFVAPSDVEGIEVYRGFAEMPGDLHDDSGCGIVSIWTRRGSREGEPQTLTRTLLAIGVSLLTAGMILLR